jgi:hypothetical protein
MVICCDLFCVVVAGHEYFYNDETGEATWRRPRITLSKDASRGHQPLSESYNSTQFTSPSKPQASELLDQSYDASHEQTYDSYAAEYPQDNNSYTAEYGQGHSQEQEYCDGVSVGDSSAQTDDSKNMCFHVGQDNVDVDIYKVRYGSVPHKFNRLLSHVCLSFRLSPAFL